MNALELVKEDSSDDGKDSLKKETNSKTMDTKNIEISDEDVDQLSERLSKVQTNLTNFTLEFLGLIGDIISTVESNVYTIVNQKKIDFLKVSDLADKKNEKVYFLLTGILQDLFNSTLHKMQKKESDFITDKIKELSEYLSLHQSCILTVLARETLKTLLILPRANFLTSNENEYLQSIARYVNIELNSIRSEFLESVLKICTKTCDDSLLTDEKLKDKNVFTFEFTID